MDELIPIIELEDRGVQAVMGRDLHTFLEIGRDYSNWFKDMCQYGFVEGQDYSPKTAKTSDQGGRPRKDHIITLDMAKEIAMIQRSEKGRQARRYFIECERRYRAGEMTELDEARLVQRALQITYRQVQELSAWKSENEEKVGYYDEFVADEDLILFRTLANQLQVQESQLREFLIKRRWIYRVTGCRWSNKHNRKMTVHQYRAYAEKKHLFRLVPRHEAPRVNGEVQQTLKLTPQGAEAVARVFRKHAVQLALTEEDPEKEIA